MAGESKIWRELVEAVDEGLGGEYGLGVRHLERAEKTRIDEDAGVIEFQVERHPHLLGRTSIGRASSAFVRIRATYRFERPGSLVEVDSEELETVVDSYGLAFQTVVELFDGMASLVKSFEELEGLVELYDWYGEETQGPLEDRLRIDSERADDIRRLTIELAPKEAQSYVDWYDEPDES